MQSNKKPWWAQATALVSVTASGAVTGLTFAPGTPAELSAPTSVPVHLLALEKSAAQDNHSDGALRSAIVNVARHYLRLAQTRTPAEMEALIWGTDSVDGADHGPSCAAFASLTLELGAQAVGQHSWVSGGGTYPWPLHDWADVRVDPNAASPQVISVLQDAQSHGRWHPLGAGYQPQPGDWVLFDGHVEVVTGYSGGVLETIGGDSLPNYSVNAHSYQGSLSDYGIAGFVDNGNLPASGAVTAPQHDSTGAPAPANAPTRPTGPVPARTGEVGGAALPGSTPKPSAHAHHTRSADALAAIPGANVTATDTGTATQEPAPAPHEPPRTTHEPPPATHEPAPATHEPPPATHEPAPAAHESATSTHSPHHQAEHAPHGYTKADPGTVPMPTASAQHAFINQIAPGAMATQRQYGVPAAVTIAQAIDESGWGQSELAVKAYNLFGIKGTGPAGSVTMPTREYENGTWVSVSASFRAYHDYAESIADHARLLATDSAYRHAMADRTIPDAFAADLAGVYATNPGYGGQIVAIMRLYDLYRFDVAMPTSPQVANPHLTPHLTPHATHTANSHATAGVIEPTIPGAPTAQAPSAARPGAQSAPAGAAEVPGPVMTMPAPAAGHHVTVTAPARQQTASASTARGAPTIPGMPTMSTTTARVARPYRHRIPLPVATAFLTTAKVPLTRNEPLYRDVAELVGVPWELLAACDWLQCEAKAGVSPVQGEKLGKVNRDGTVYHTKSEALGQCAADLIGLSKAVYGIDVTTGAPLSVHDLANVFAAFRWGGLLRRNGISAMEFPYSVAGLTNEHLRMCWPRISGGSAPDKPGTRFRGAFGAVPLLLSLKYPATV